jgi:hypothetical protein
MTIKIDNEIVGYKVVDQEAEEAAKQQQPTEAEIIHMHEKVSRPEELEGSTYKIITPMSEHAMYVTINDIILNQGTDHEQRRPYEVFINSKNLEHFQWVVALTRVISAVFRKGGDITFLVEELKAVFDPQGGYFKKGGVFMPSLVAEIGFVIEIHLKKIGMLQSEEMSDHQKAILAEKRAAFEKQNSSNEAEGKDTSFPEGSQLCGKCSTKAVIKMDGCMTCLNCGDSKCG